MGDNILLGLRFLLYFRWYFNINMMEQAAAPLLSFNTLNLQPRRMTLKQSFTVSGYNFVRQCSLQTIASNPNCRPLPSNLFQPNQVLSDCLNNLCNYPIKGSDKCTFYTIIYLDLQWTRTPESVSCKIVKGTAYNLI